MYDENVTVKVGVNWKEIVIKIILLIIFILVLCWLFPKPDLDVFYDSVYTNNINTMRDAAKSYYTVDKLPEKVGDSTSMTLGDMIDNHMIIRFTDKNGKTCDEKTSRVEVTKTSEKEYVLKVVLNCGDQKDYILETIGCTSVCTGENCTIVNNYISNNENGNGSNNESNNGSNQQQQEDDPRAYEGGGNGSKDGLGDKVYTVDTTYYQFRKAVTTSKVIYTCPSGYTKNGMNCYRNGVGASIKATAVYYPDSTKITEAKISDGRDVTVYADYIKTLVSTEYSCPSGYTKNGSYCIKYTDAKETVVSDYTCPSGYTKNGTSCYKIYDAKVTSGSYSCPKGGTLSGTNCIYDATAVSSEGTCPSGYTKNGSQCYYTYSAKVVAGSYSCPNGGSLSGTNCVYTATKTTSEGSCPSGYTKNGTQCYYTYNAKVTAGAYSCPKGGSLSGSTCTYTATASSSYGSWVTAGTYYYTSASKAYTNTTSKLVYVGAVSGATCGSPCGNSGIWYKYTYYTRSTNTSYSCPSGGSLSGTKCSYAATKGGNTYSCPDGGSLSGTKCTITKSVGSGSTSYTCPKGGSLSGTNCTYAATKGGNTYTCPDGGSLSGTKCTITKSVSGGSTTYKCELGGTPNSSHKCSYAASQGGSSYSCPDGGTLSGTKCTIVKAATRVDDKKYSCDLGTLNEKTKKCEYTIAATKENVYSYTCPTGYTKSGDKEKTICSKVISSPGTYYCEDSSATLNGNKCYKVVKGEFSHYTCPSSEYTLNGDVCTKNSVDVQPATPYNETSTSYKYTWSKYSKLDGWEFTGKTKVVSEKYKAGQQ